MVDHHKSTIEKFAAFAAHISHDDIPDRVIEKVKLQIITYLTAAKFSDWHQGAYKVYCTEKNRNTKPAKASVIALNKKLSAEEAAYVNTAYGMTLDFDGYMLMGHMGHSAVYTPLAFLEETGGTMGELVAAVTACNEVQGRLSFSCFFGPLNGQMWSYIHTLGAATAVARAKGFDTDKTAHAMALSLYEPNFCLAPGFLQEDSKLLTAAIPLRTGIQAALLAEQGLRGPWNIIDAPLGFLRFFSFHPIREVLENLGEAWLSDTLSYKRYPGTSYIAAAADSALSALQSLGKDTIIHADEVDNITIDTTLLSYSMENISKLFERPELTAIDINFSVRYTVAYALIRGDLKPDFFKNEQIKKHEKAIGQLAEKIKVRHDWAMSARTINAFPDIWPILKRMNRYERNNIRAHLQALNKAAPAKGMKETIMAFKQILSVPSGRNIIKQLFQQEQRPFNLMDMNLPEYSMLQSARTTISLKNGTTASSEFPIPTGGAGLAFEEQKRWVKKRLELAFEKDPEKIFDHLNDPDRPVSLFLKEILRQS